MLIWYFNSKFLVGKFPKYFLHELTFCQAGHAWQKWHFHACYSHTHEAVLQNIFKFCTFLPKFSNILPLIVLFLPFFEKSHIYPYFLQEGLSRELFSVTIQATFPQSFRKHYSEAKTIIDCGSFHINLTWPCNGVLTPLIKHTSYQNGNP